MGFEAHSALKCAGVLPYSAVITNRGDTPLVALGVRFSLVVTGRPVNRDFFYYAFPPNSPILGVGQSQVFTPLKRLNDVAHHCPHQGDSADAMRSEQDAMALLGSAAAMHITVDVALSADGRTAGPDQGQALKRMTELSKGAHDLIEECQVRLQQGISDSDLASWLTSFANPPMMGDYYAGVQQNLAEAWLNSLQHGRRSELEGRMLMATKTEDSMYRLLKSARGGLEQ
jgi:hypothetical protein